jgi:DNA-binding NarL/FixJ family response regulator
MSQSVSNRNMSDHASSLKRPDRQGDQTVASPDENRRSGVHPTSTLPASEKTRTSWTVVEEFVRDGYSYRVARRPIRNEGVERLTKREQEALEYALDGFSNKTIAYALGLAPSTVGVLLFRAAGKLGVKSRRELLTAYSRAKSENEPR